MLQVVPYVIPYFIPATILAGYWYGGLSGYGIVFWIYIAVPWLDSLLGSRFGIDLGRVDPPSPRASLFCRTLLWLWVPTQLAMLFGTLYVVEHHNLDPVRCWAISAALGLAGGVVGFTVAHELSHHHSGWERKLGLLLAATLSYPHFCIQHVHIHHRYVGTPKDPATAKLGESLYAFVFRSAGLGIYQSFQFESQRLQRAGKSAWSFENRFLQGVAIYIGLVIAVVLLFGVRGLLVFLAQGLISIFLLEATNYVQHYGLERREVSPGRFEPISPLHCWNVEHRLTNWLLFNLGRHSEHHCAADRHFEQLSAKVEGPVLPLGLTGMVVMSFFPPLWRSAMDPRVMHWRGVNESLVESKAPSTSAESHPAYPNFQ